MKTIVMIHGMWGGSWYWENFVQYFSAKAYRCLTPVLRYHDVKPGSEPNPRLGTTSILDYAQDLEEEIKKLDDQPILIGHSMGGLLAQILAARRQVSAVVLVTPASPAGIMALKPSVLKSFWTVMTKRAFWRKPMLIPFRAASYSLLNALSPDEQREKYARFVYESGRAAAEIGFWMFDRYGAARVDDKKIACPLLVMAGGKDLITPSSVTKKIAKKYGEHSTYLEFAGKGHWMMEEEGWEEVAGTILEWLQEQKL